MNEGIYFLKKVFFKAAQYVLMILPFHHISLNTNLVAMHLFAREKGHFSSNPSGKVMANIKKNFSSKKCPLMAYSLILCSLHMSV